MKVEEKFLFCVNFHVIITRLQHGNFEFPIRTVYRTKIVNILRKFQIKIIFKSLKKIMKRGARNHLQQIVVLTFIFTMRLHTTKSIKKFLKSCISKMMRNANMKCSGTRLVNSESRPVERGWVGKGGEMGMKGQCY